MAKTKPMIRNLRMFKTELRGRVLQPKGAKGSSIEVLKVYSSLERAAHDYGLRSSVAAGQLSVSGLPNFTPLAPPAPAPKPAKQPPAPVVAAVPEKETAPAETSQEEGTGEEGTKAVEDDFSDWEAWDDSEMVYKLAQAADLKGRSKIRDDAASLIAKLQEEGSVTDAMVASVRAEYE